MNQLTFYEVAMVTVRRRWMVGLCTLTAFGASVIYAIVSPPVYRAEVLLSPTQSNDQSANGLSGQLGGLASLAGLSVHGASDRRVEALATLQSRDLTETFVRERDLLPVLFSSRWDDVRHVWKADEKPPTLWDANKLISEKVRKVVEDKKTGLVTLAIEWTDPVLASDWATDMVARTNRHLAQGAMDRASRNIVYLKQQLGETSIIEMRQALYSLMESELKTNMLAQSSDEYAFKILDPAVSPQDKVRPQRLLIVVLGLSIGLLISVLLMLLAEVTASLIREHRINQGARAA